MMDISTMPLKGLEQLLAALPHEIEKRRTQERGRVLEELAALARVRGFALDELMPAPQTSSNVMPTLTHHQRRRARVKFRHPLNSALAWAGRGRQPKWVEAWLAEGKALKDLQV